MDNMNGYSLTIFADCPYRIAGPYTSKEMAYMVFKDEIKSIKNWTSAAITDDDTGEIVIDIQNK